MIDAPSKKVSRWIEVRTIGNSRAVRPTGLAIAPANSAIYPRPYVVVLNQYANFATVIDAASDTVVGEFETGFYAERAVFNSTGTRLYVTDRFKDQVRVFDVTAGPFPSGSGDPDRNKRSRPAILGTSRSIRTGRNCTLPIRSVIPSL